jgi:hypothetical protein
MKLLKYFNVPSQLVRDTIIMNSILQGAVTESSISAALKKDFEGKVN